ncbi:unnamed protein product [Bursaphelenchus okinawaensis]|uniref:Uncharacterized protein n=1 Tax=Bursaphelenchus okinawaensis TaxID=465554 RepID=A0A811LFN2_9BILA|nr:unnamed protein product [Bursaphelenchus okinawaensis]CAG9122061.1 unnamed protein product [Bursaphelenchus okinawaensis]
MLLLITQSCCRSIDVENTSINPLNTNSTNILSTSNESFSHHMAKFFEMLSGFLQKGSIVLAVFLFLFVQYLGYKMMKYIGRRCEEGRIREKESQKIQMEEVISVSTTDSVPHVQRF